jgi:hypothetical protein
MNIDTNKLREIAERATPGPWAWWTSYCVKRLTTGGGPDGGGLHATMVRQVHVDTACSPADMDHLAPFDPTTVLALLDQVEQLQRDAARLADAQKVAGMVPKGHRNDGYPRKEDGDFVQEAALKCGLIEKRTANEPRGEGCPCTGFVGADGFPADCYLNTDAVIAAMSQAWVKNG